MRQTLRYMGVLMGALTIATAPAQIVYSFETEDLHGYAGSATGGWEVFQEGTIGVTHGSYSMGVWWPEGSGGFRWLLGNGVRDELLPYLQVSRKLLIDATADVSVPWSNLIVAFNDEELGWRQTAYSFGLPRVSGTRTVLLDLESLLLPDPNNTEWFQMNLGLNAGDSHRIYFDQLRLYRSECEMPAMDFTDTLHGFAPDPEDPGASVSLVGGKMRVELSDGFHWIFGGTVPGLAAMLRRGDLVVMDITVVSPPPQGWGNMIVAINSDAGWGQANYVAEVAAGNGTFTRTVALDYRDATLPDSDSPEYCLLNLGFSSGGGMTIDIDNIRIYRKAVEGDVDCNGCVNDLDLLTVLFDFGSSGVSPSDVNNDGTVNDLDLLTVLFNFGIGC
jgi:hypothetical protein